MPGTPSGSDDGGGVAVPDRRRLRGEYRDLLKDSRDRRLELALDTAKFQDAVNRANALGAQVEKAREQCMDTEFLAHLSEVGVCAAKNLDPGAEARNPGDLVDRLISSFVGSTDPKAALEENPGAFNWAALGASVARYFAGGVGLACMLGPLEDAKPKERKRAGPREKKRGLAAEVNPDQLANATTDAEKQETDHNLLEMHRVLMEHKSIPLPLLVLNKRSLAQTIENIFTLSFLVKMAKASIGRGTETEYVNVEVVAGDAPPGAPAQPACGSGRQQVQIRQLVTSFDHADWEAMVQDVGDHATYIPHRQHDFAALEGSPGAEGPGPDVSPTTAINLQDSAIRHNLTVRPMENSSQQSHDFRDENQENLDPSQEDPGQAKKRRRRRAVLA